MSQDGQVSARVHGVPIAGALTRVVTSRTSAQLSCLTQNHGSRLMAAYNLDAESQVRRVFPCEERAVSTNMRRHPRHAFLKTCESAQARAHEGAYRFSRTRAHSHRSQYPQTSPLTFPNRYTTSRDCDVTFPD